MPSALVRRVVLIGIALALAVAAAFATIPYIAATQLVRDRIAFELSMWSGYKVTLASAPRVDIWPVFKAELADVTFSEWEGSPQPVVHADRIETGLSAFAALRGDVVFTSVKLIRPTLNIWREALRTRPTTSWSGGRFRQAVAEARLLIEADPANPDASKLRSDAVGTIEFVDGRMALHGNGQETEILSGVSGTLDWPALNRAATLRATGIWRGEIVSLEVTGGQPLFLAAGGSSQVSGSMQSAPLSGSFQGTANTANEAYLRGSLKLNSPSMRRMLEWSHTDIAAGAAVGAFSLQGELSGAVNRLKVANATLGLDTNQATGTLEMALWGPVPSIMGTLAFDTIDLRSFLAAFSALTPDGGGRYRTVDSNVGDQLALDLRLSATRAAAGPVVFTNLAATAQIKAGLAAFDISDATVFDGNVQAGMRVDRHSEQAAVEIRLRGSHIDMGALARTLQIHQLVPITRADFALTLKGSGETTIDVLRTAGGSFTASFGPGAMAGIDLARFSERAKSGEFFPLHEVGNGSLTFNRIDVKAAIADGIARVEEAAVQLAAGGMTLRGIVPLPGRGLALAGTLAAPAGASDTPVSFFVGGSWDAPYISPVMPGLGLP